MLKQQAKNFSEKKKNIFWNTLFWWKTNESEIRYQANNYYNLRFGSYRTISALLLVFSSILTTIFINWSSIVSRDSYVEVAIFLLLAIFVYFGHRWAMVLAMIFWTIGKFLFTYEAITTSKSGQAGLQILWWTVYMNYLFKAYKVEQLKKKISKISRPEMIGQGDNAQSVNLGCSQELQSSASKGKYKRINTDKKVQKADEHEYPMSQHDFSGICGTYYMVELLHKAAEQGDSNAQFNLGVMYDNGEGVPKDTAKAFEWYQKAATQGHDSAQFNLGTMYGNGEGVPRDLVLAYAWFNLSATQEGESKKYAKNARGMVDKKLTPAERAEAQSLFLNWKIGEILKRVGK